MIGMVHNRMGEMPTLVGRMPTVPGLPGGNAPGYTIQGASGVQIQGPPEWERAASTGTFWDRVEAKRYELPPGQGLNGAIAHGMGLGAPIVHGMGLGSLGISEEDLNALAASLHAKGDKLTTGDIAGAMELLTKDERNTLGAKLVSLGVPSTKVTAAKVLVKASDPGVKRNMAIWGVLGTISMAASAYHGYKRNDSIGWAIWWGLMGSLFPVLTPVIGVAQGFAKPKGA